MKPEIAILSGMTASGKTALALEFCQSHKEIEILNADSVLIYRGMDIGSAKPTLAERQGIPHHLIDIHDPGESFTAGDFYRELSKALHDIQARGKRALIVGGTGFYLKAILYGLWEAEGTDPALRAELEKCSTPELAAELQTLDPEWLKKVSHHDRYRIVRALEIIKKGGKKPSELERTRNSVADPRFKLFVLDRPSDELQLRIEKRTQEMLALGLVQEVEGLLKNHPSARPLQSVGYAQTVRYLKNQKPTGRKIREGLAGLEEEILLATRQLVKRQRTWFRGEKSSQWIILEHDRAKLIEELRTIYS